MNEKDTASFSADELKALRARGKGHLSRMNAVLRSYMEAHSRD